MTRRDLWVDFNDIDATGHITSAQRFASPPTRKLDLGEVLVVGDDEGNRAEAVVTALVGELVTVRVTSEVVSHARNVSDPVEVDFAWMGQVAMFIALVLLFGGMAAILTGVWR